MASTTLNLESLPEITLIPSRGRKKTMSLRIHDNGRITLRFPARLSIRHAINFIHSKRAWLKKKLQAFCPDRRIQKREGFFKGRLIPYLGKSFPLCLDPPHKESAAAPLAFTGEKFILQAQFKKDAEQLFVAWYKRAASNILATAVKHFSAQMGVTPASIRISSARSRWGSCSAKDTLSFSWRIALLPQDIIEYIVVHELAHLIHKNHGRTFWDAIGNFIPDYKTKKKQLRNHHCCAPA
jgi:hypothetical protein